MEKVTQRYIKSLVSAGIAVSLDKATTDKAYAEIMGNEGYLTQYAYAAGVYGCNGKLFQGHNTGTIYAVTTRNTAIFLY